MHDERSLSCLALASTRSAHRSEKLLVVCRIERFQVLKASRFEGPVRGVPTLEEAEIDLMCVELRSVDTDKLRFAAHLDAAPAAHAGSVDHDRIQRRNRLDFVRSCQLGNGTHHRNRTCGEHNADIFSGDDIVVAENTLNAPQRRGTGQPYFTYDDTKDEFIHAIVLALNVFTVEDYASGSIRDEKCETKNWGRGCLYLIGGLIQGSWGDLGENGRGYDLRASYNSCVRESAPPQFPATRDFSRKRVVEMNGATFNVANWFADYQS